MSKFSVGDTIKLKGYGANVPEEVKLLEKGKKYTIYEVIQAESLVTVEVDNPTYDKSQPISDDNPDKKLAELYFDEIEMAEAAVKEEKVASRAAKGRSAAKTKVVEEVEETEEEDEAEEPVVETKQEAKIEEKPKRGPKKVVKPVADEESTTPIPKEASTNPILKKPKQEAKEKQEVINNVPVQQFDEEGMEILQNEDPEILEMVKDADDLLQLASEIDEEGMSLDYKLAGVLYHIRLTKVYKKLDVKYEQKGGPGKPSGFQLYLEERLSVGYRKAMNLIQTYIAFNKFGISGSVMGHIGWTKASKIAPFMTEENADALLDLAETKSVAELSKSISESYKDVSDTDKRKKIKFVFKLWEDEATGVQDILQKAADMLGVEGPDLSSAFEHIVKEWAIAQDEGQEPVKETKQTEAKHRTREREHVKAA